jgi:hypothetical protein
MRPHDKSQWLLIVYFFWLPQLLWAAGAVGVLVLAMVGVPSSWIRWVLLLVPYLMIGLAFYVIQWLGQGDNWTWEYFAPTVVAVPVLLGLHLWWFTKEPGNGPVT